MKTIYFLITVVAFSMTSIAGAQTKTPPAKPAAAPAAKGATPEEPFNPAPEALVKANSALTIYFNKNKTVDAKTVNDLLEQRDQNCGGINIKYCWDLTTLESLICNKEPFTAFYPFLPALGFPVRHIKTPAEMDIAFNGLKKCGGSVPTVSKFALGLKFFEHSALNGWNTQARAIIPWITSTWKVAPEDITSHLPHIIFTTETLYKAKSTPIELLRNLYLMSAFWLKSPLQASAIPPYLLLSWDTNMKDMLSVSGYLNVYQRWTQAIPLASLVKEPNHLKNAVAWRCLVANANRYAAGCREIMKEAQKLVTPDKLGNVIAEETANTLMTESKYAEAKAELDKLIAKDPGNPWHQFTMSMIQVGLNNMPQARASADAFTKGVAGIFPWHAEYGNAVKMYTYIIDKNYTNVIGEAELIKKRLRAATQGAETPVTFDLTISQLMAAAKTNNIILAEKYAAEADGILKKLPFFSFKSGYTKAIMAALKKQPDAKAIYDGVVARIGFNDWEAKVLEAAVK